MEPDKVFVKAFNKAKVDVIGKIEFVMTIGPTDFTIVF